MLHTETVLFSENDESSVSFLSWHSWQTDIPLTFASADLPTRCELDSHRTGSRGVRVIVGKRG